MKQVTTWIFTAALAAALGCATDTGTFTSALTGDECEPDFGTLVADPTDEGANLCFKSNNGHGNNEDGVDSSNPGAGHGGPNGEVDQSCDGTGECIDDEMRPGPADPSECEIPEGCDADGCCRDEEPDPQLDPEPESNPEPEPEPETEPDPEIIIE